MPRTGLDFRAKGFVRPVVLLAAVCALALGLLACGGDDEEGGEADTTATAASGGSAATATAAGSGASATTASGGSGSGGSASPTATSGGSSGGGLSAAGNKVAQDSMIAVTDLPGTGWTLESSDDYSASFVDTEPDDFGDSPTCQAYGQAVTKAAEKAEQDAIGRASRTFVGEGALLPSNLYVDVTVYDNDDTPEELVSEAKKAFGSSGFQACFEELTKQSTEGTEGLEFEVKTVNASKGAPHNGLAQAFDMTFGAAGFTLTMRAEIYVWRNDEAVAFITVVGAPESMDAALVAAAVDKTDSKMGAAQ